jgi:hypothetical protein
MSAACVCMHISHISMKCACARWYIVVGKAQFVYMSVYKWLIVCVCVYIHLSVCVI